MVATTRSASRSKSTATSPSRPLSPSTKKTANTFNSVVHSAEPAAKRWPVCWFVFGGLFLALEFALKYLAFIHPPSLRVFTLGQFLFVELCSVINPNSAFSMLRNVPEWAKTSLMLFSVLVLLLIVYQQVNSPTSTVLTRRGVFCLVIGALGNGPDRFLVGGVVDYIYFQAGAWMGHYSLAWNLSDLMINCGLAHMIWSAVQEERKTKAGDDDKSQ